MTQEYERIIWATKAPNHEFDTFTVSHPAMTTRRYVMNVFSLVTIGGNVFTPLSASVTYPEIDDEMSPSFSIDLYRPVVGDELEKAMNEISPIQRILHPVTCTLAHYIVKDDGSYYEQASFDMYLDDKGISMTEDYVSLSCSRDNPMASSCALIYEVAEWTGLESS